MDPVTAWALAVKAIAEMITEVVRGQPPEVRKQAWEWWMADQDRWRRLLKLDP
jgi:hypothetical protein